MDSDQLIPERIKAWIGQIRTQGFDALWHRLTDSERSELSRFSAEFERGFQMEVDSQWQAAADRYQTVAEQFPAYADIAVKRAEHIVADKINRAIRYYNQGVQALEAKMYTKAMQFFDLAINVDPHMEKALYNLGMTHRMMYISDPVGNKFARDTAVTTFQRLLKMNPDHIKAAAQIEQLRRL